MYYCYSSLLQINQPVNLKIFDNKFSLTFVCRRFNPMPDDFRNRLFVFSQLIPDMLYGNFYLKFSPAT